MPILGVVASSKSGHLLPFAPTIGTATPGSAQTTVTFTPSGTGPAATSFTATSSPGGFTVTGASSPLTVTGLSNGTAYTFTVHATNAAGNSAESAATTPPVTPAPILYTYTTSQTITLTGLVTVLLVGAGLKTSDGSSTTSGAGGNSGYLYTTTTTLSGSTVLTIGSPGTSVSHTTLAALSSASGSFATGPAGIPNSINNGANGTTYGVTFNGTTYSVGSGGSGGAANNGGSSTFTGGAGGSGTIGSGGSGGYGMNNGPTPPANGNPASGYGSGGGGNGGTASFYLGSYHGGLGSQGVCYILQ